MGRARRKKGKTARRARQGLLGFTRIAREGKKPKQFEKRVNQRLDRKDDVRTEEILRENIAGQKTQEEPRTPHAFVIHSAGVGRYVRQLEMDLRRVMSPNTSKALRVLKRNKLKDFVVHSQFLGVSHLIILSRTELSTHLRIIRNPQGPTLHFRVEKYSLARDVLSVQKRPVIYEELFQHAPLVVMNGFSSEDSSNKHLQLVQTVVQNMFPSIDVDRVKLASIRRTLLLNYDTEDGLIEFRQYSIKSVPAGVSRSTKKLMQSKVPDLSKYKDISDFMLKPEQLSDSEFEGEQTELELTQDIGGRGKKRGQQTKLRLMEIGPRMTLRLMKIEEGVNAGTALWTHPST
ncbi:hypothetical protein niasHS_010103 [Heterodera schachtii]|uniref:Brix domain-containing protein n=1 Tax=Heterodera schachtii TaxID=97005 RepID=A0ABD2IYR6_HETSC